METPLREQLIEARFRELKDNPHFDGVSDEDLRRHAEEFVSEEIDDFKLMLTPDQVLAVHSTLFKAKSFLRRGKRHLNTGFFPEDDVLDLDSDALAVAIQYMEAHTFRLSKRDIEVFHQGCACHQGTVRLVWQKDSKQLIYTT